MQTNWTCWLTSLYLVGCAAANAGPAAASRAPGLDVPPERTDAHSAAEFPGLEALPEDEVGVHSLAAPFETSTHTEMIRDGSLPSHCVDLLAKAQWRQDVVLSTWAPAHFDNCRFDEGHRYIASLLADAEGAAAKGDRDGMLVALGRALHGIQDFYAHTNYVELMASGAPAGLADVPVLDVWGPDGPQRLRDLVAKGLVSGHVWWEPGDTCQAPFVTHAALNKDSPKSTEGAKVIAAWGMTEFRAAHELAIRATHKYLHEFLARPAWAALVGSDCNGLVGFDVTSDRRVDRPYK